MSRRLAAVVFAVVIVGAGRARAASAEHAYQLVESQQIEEAQKEIEALAKKNPHDPEVAFVDGDLLLHRGDYARAHERFAEAEKARGRLGDEAKELARLAQSTAEVVQRFESQKSEHFTVYYAPGKDALLAPYALSTLEAAYRALGDDFGWRPSQPVRVEIYGDVGELARVSTLTRKEIETSGTIALCKYNRIMVTSPRALLAGYPWLDTLTHEYTHYVVTRISRNTVPIWLHEGLAKFEERRWHAPSGGGLTPTMEHLLASGLAHDRLVPFAKMYPSMAKLPSQHQTALAFAEVYTAVEFLHERGGFAGLKALIARMRDGAGNHDFEPEWRKWLAARKLRLHPGLVPEESELRFKKSGAKANDVSDDDARLVGEERAKKWARLGGMLRARHRLAAAAAEYEKAQAIVGPGNPRVANKLARTYLELGDPRRAITAAEPALALYPDEAAPNATLGEAWLKLGDKKRARPYLEAALAVNPFDPHVRCGLADVYADARAPRADEEARACQALR